MVTCPIDPYDMDFSMDQNIYLWNRWTDFFRSKVYGIVSICSCAASLSFTHSTHIYMGLYNGWNAYLWSYWRIFSVRSSMELSFIVVVQRHGHLPIWLTWAFPYAKVHICETALWIYSAYISVEFSRPVVVWRYDRLPISPIWSFPWANNLSNLVPLRSRYCESISLKPLAGFTLLEVRWNYLDL